MKVCALASLFVGAQATPLWYEKLFVRNCKNAARNDWTAVAGPCRIPLK
jgi:hypothetical protein